MLGLVLLSLRAVLLPGGFGKVYVVPQQSAAVEVAQLDNEAKGGTKSSAVIRWSECPPFAPNATLSWPRTLGLWTAALLTLCVFSYLFADNVGYKFAEALVVGVSAGFAMVVGFWDTIVAQLLVKLTPDLVRAWALPLLPPNQSPDYWYLVPLALGAMLFGRYVRGLAWLAQWPIAFIVGTTAGLKLVLVIDADFANQIRSTIVPLVVISNGQFDWWLSVRNLLLVVGVVASLSYFLFSFPGSRALGRLSRVGIWFLMITFGASFAFTVMGRITLLTMRLQFLFDDWLWLIDPSGKRLPS